MQKKGAVGFSVGQRGRFKPSSLALQLVIDVILPIVTLSYFSSPQLLGGEGALIVASLLPLVHFSYEWLRYRSLSLFSLMGLVLTLVGGGLALVSTNGIFYAVKEGAIDLGLALAFFTSLFIGKPLFMVFAIHGKAQDQAEQEKLWQEWSTPEARRGFRRYTLGWAFFLLATFAKKVILALLIIHAPFGSTDFDRQVAFFAIINWPIHLLMYGAAIGFTWWSIHRWQKHHAAAQLQPIKL